MKISPGYLISLLAQHNGDRDAAAATCRSHADQYRTIALSCDSYRQERDNLEQAARWDAVVAALETPQEIAA